jgi:hypothetical protein
MTSDKQTDYDQPVAYDKDGRPLYARPANEEAPQRQVVEVTRSHDPAEPVITPEILKKHEDSVAKHPTLNLSKGEYIISEVRRHWIGLLGSIVAGGFLVFLVFAGLAMYPMLVPGGNPPFDALLMPALLLLVLIGLGTYIVAWVYLNNKFFLTNESVVQEIQTSLFAHNEQTVSLGNIEDASYTQTGMLQLLLNYGSIRLSTQGDETTYRFQYVSNPKQQIAILNNAVEAFKNGRPVETD